MKTFAALLVASLFVVSCSSSSTTTSSNTSGGTADAGGGGGSDAGSDAGNGATASITVASFQFTPASLTVKPGTAVTWTFGPGGHNVVSGSSCTSDGKFTSGSPGAVTTYTHTFDTAGTYDYFCQPHCSIGMKGTVIVAP